MQAFTDLESCTSTIIPGVVPTSQADFVIHGARYPMTLGRLLSSEESTLPSLLNAVCAIYTTYSISFCRNFQPLPGLSPVSLPLAPLPGIEPSLYTLTAYRAAFTL